MPAQDRKFYQPGINMYVKAMAYSADLLLGQPTVFSLGTPAASSATKFLTAANAQAVALTEVAVPAAVQIVDSPYGRNVILTPSGDPGNAFVQDVYGQDYMGQPMIERFTGANGATAILYGKKAFYRVLKIRNITASTNAITVNLGTGTRLGLPYKGDVAYAKEATVPVAVYKRDFALSVPASASDSVAGFSALILSPSPGFIKNVFGQGAGLGGANPNVLTVKLATVAIVGLTASIPQNASTYTVGVPTTAGYSANNRLLNNSPIQLLSAAAAGGFPFTAGVTITPTQMSLPDLTDPATAITGDPRGTYEALMTLDGVSQIVAGLSGDNSVNASGNGGLLGIQHFFA